MATKYRSVKVLGKKGKVRTVKVSYTSLRKSYYKERVAPYKKEVYVKGGLSVKKIEAYKLKTGANRKVLRVNLKRDAETGFKDTEIKQLKYANSNKSYKMAYMKATIRVKTEDGRVIPFKVVTDMHSNIVADKMFNQFETGYKNGVDKISEYYKAESVKLIKVEIHYVPTGNGI